MPSFDKTCARCGTDFVAGAAVAKFCPPCRTIHNRERRHVPHPDQKCETCDRTYTPYRHGQRYCSDCSGANQAGHRNVPRDEQMDKLFRYYKAKTNITVDSAPDGTRLLSLSDTQFPFVDEPLLDAVYQFVQDWKPNVIILNGDLLDCFELSDFDKRPERLFNLDSEFEMAREFLLRLKRYAAKDCQIFWIDGNHEERLQRVIWRRAQDFSFLVKDIPEALGLDELCAGYVPYGKHIDYLGFVFTHGNFVSSYSAYTAKRHYDRYRSSGVNGHTHRLGSYSATDMHGRSHTWFEQGCLCRRDLDYVKGVANWQSGFLISTVAGGVLHPQLVHVIEAKGKRGFFAGGKHYDV